MRAPGQPLILASVRDVLVSKRDPAKHQRMLDTVGAHYDAVLVHGDPALLPFADSFPLAERLGDRLLYTGLVVPELPADAPANPPAVLVSAGGGAVGADLLLAALAARPLTRFATQPWLLVTGEGLPAEHVAALTSRIPPGVTLARHRPDLARLIGAAARSRYRRPGTTPSPRAWRPGRAWCWCRSPPVARTSRRAGLPASPSLGLATHLPEAELSPAKSRRRDRPGRFAAAPRPGRPAARRCGANRRPRPGVARPPCPRLSAGSRRPWTRWSGPSPSGGATTMPAATTSGCVGSWRSPARGTCRWPWPSSRPGSSRRWSRPSWTRRRPPSSSTGSLTPTTRGPARRRSSWAVRPRRCAGPASSPARERLARRFGDAFLPVLVPPWNRIDRDARGMPASAGLRRPVRATGEALALAPPGLQAGQHPSRPASLWREEPAPVDAGGADRAALARTRADALSRAARHHEPPPRDGRRGARWHSTGCWLSFKIIPKRGCRAGASCSGRVDDGAAPGDPGSARSRSTTDGRQVEAVAGAPSTCRPTARVALVGESGSGKTVISQAILGILPAQRPHHRRRDLFADPRSRRPAGRPRHAPGRRARSAATSAAAASRSSSRSR